MKINMNTLLLLQQTLEKIAMANLPIKFQVAIRYNLKKISQETESFVEVRDNLIQKYGEIDKDGNTLISPESENFNIFVEELNPVLAEIIEIPTLRYFNIDIDEFLDILSENNENILLNGIDLEVLQLLSKETDEAN